MRTYLLDQQLSLDRSVSDEDGRRFIDFIVDPNQPDEAPVERLVDEAMTTEVRRLLEHLKPIEADILRQRFGLEDDKELTLKEIGEKYNLSVSESVSCKSKRSSRCESGLCSAAI